MGKPYFVSHPYPIPIPHDMRPPSSYDGCPPPSFSSSSRETSPTLRKASAKATVCFTCGGSLRQPNMEEVPPTSTTTPKKGSPVPFIQYNLIKQGSPQFGTQT
ncbi:hypothetical protein SK128_007680 [Halocaridina rubra]|uniref:Uncharacterized protein n=1 Tax=Halocaridina rubra TaxID=373956 RepID=A0AAN8WYT2_HALRR